MLTRTELEAAAAEIDAKEWDAIKDKWPHNPNAPRPPDTNINLDPDIKAMAGQKRSDKTGVPTNVLPLSNPTNGNAIKEILRESVVVREKALVDARKALEEAFAPKFKEMFDEKLKEEQFNPQSIEKDLTENPLLYGNIKDKDGKVWGAWKEEPSKDKTIVIPLLSTTPASIVNVWNAAMSAGINPQVLGNADPTSKEYQDGFRLGKDIKRRSEETKKIMTNFHKGMATYPKYISHEGSTVLCVLLSMDPNPMVLMEGLPASDKEIIFQSLPETVNIRDVDNISVTFDEQKDFILTCFHADKVVHTIRLFNTVIHPQNIPLPTSVVEVEDGDKISIGGKVIMDKSAVKKLLGFKPELNKKEDEKEEPRRQPVAGRNAFEIRTDIMQMALDWATKSGKSTMSPDEVVNVAKKFYTFVENKRY